MQTCRFLVVDDAPLTAQLVAQILGDRGEVVTGRDLQSARRACNEPWTGVFMELWLGKRNVLPILAEISPLARGPRCIVLTTGGGLERESAELQRAGVVARHKPRGPEDIREDLERAIGLAHATELRIELLVDKFQDRYGWSTEVRTVARMTLMGARGRDEIAARTGKSPNTVKHQISALVKSAGIDDLEGFVRLAFSEVLRSSIE